MMTAKDVNKIAIVGFILALLGGCSNVTPDVALLRSVDALEFSPSTITTSSLTSVSLQASCSEFIGGIEMSLDGGATWITPSSYDPSATSNCKSGKFSVTLSNQKAPWDSQSVTAGQSLAVKFRTQPRPGNYFYKDVTIIYSPSIPKSQEVLVGSAEQTGGAFKIRTKLRAQSQVKSQGGGYAINGRIVQ